jgi:SP family facilitated glucose transporter-like MFS transporter 3
MIYSFIPLILGRLIVGISIGGYACVCPLLISEMAPPYLMGPLGIMNQMGACTGVVIAYSLAFLAPYSVEEEAKTTRIWRVLFIFPGIFFSVIQLVLMIFIFRYDSPKYYKIKQNKNQYNNVMKKIYKSYERENIHNNQNNEKSKSFEAANPNSSIENS